MPCILLVEDDIRFRQTVKDILSSHFPLVRIEEASDGEEAFKQIDVRNPGIVFLDLRLPGENGIVVTEKIKQKHPKIVVAILTSYDLQEYREPSLRSGAKYFFPKDAMTAAELHGGVEDALFCSGSNSKEIVADG